jgi:hypothetical protein
MGDVIEFHNPQQERRSADDAWTEQLKEAWLDIGGMVQLAVDTHARNDHELDTIIGEMAAAGDALSFVDGMMAARDRVQVALEFLTDAASRSCDALDRLGFNSPDAA